ncbi:MAG: Gfo/Idh/MocA family protein [Actinomycetota bacterium]
MAMFAEAPKLFDQSDIPAPEIIDPNSVPSLRWGILGAGDIAEVFADTVAKNTRQKIVAVASKTPGKAETFAQRFQIPKIYNNYEDLVADEEVDAVYVATLPHTHKSDALIAIAAKKHLLIEKPSALVAQDAEEIYGAAKKAGVFAMEAMWSRYLPQASIIRQLVQGGSLGHIEVIQADFGQDNRSIERLWIPGRSSIMQDMGIYPISFAQMLLGDPIKITATGSLHEGISEDFASAVLEYSSGAKAVINVSGKAHLPTTASVSGTLGVLVVDGPFFVPSGLELRPALFNSHGPRWEQTGEIQGHAGLCYQINHFAKYVGQGLLESPLQSHKDTISVIQTGEEIRRQVGVKL